MNTFFIHVYLDEDVNVLLAALVKSRGFDATTTCEAGQLGRSDREQLQFATDREMAIVTHNRADFEALASEYYAAARSHAGIVISVRRPIYQIAEKLLQVLDDLTAEEMANQVIYI